MKNVTALSVIGLALAGLTPGAASAQAGCTAYDAQSAAINPDLNAAFELMEVRKIPEATAYLPALEGLLDGVPARMPVPEKCGADVLVFDTHQLAGFQALQAAGKRVPGYPANANFVAKGLPFESLAYAVGWLHYENGDFTSALAAYQKGLAIAPNSHDLVNEVLATQINLKAFADVIDLADRFLATDTDADGKARSNVMLAKGLGQAMLGDATNAEISVDAALALWPENESAMDLKNQLSHGS